MKKRKIIIRYENAKNEKENFIINSNTSLMKVPAIGEKLNINKLQYLVDKVVTNINLTKYGNKEHTMDEFDGISYYVKLIRGTDNENKCVQEKEINTKLDRIIECISTITDSNTGNSNIINNSTDNELIKILEKIKSMVATTVTEYDLKDLKDYIGRLHGDGDKVNTNVKNDKKEEIIKDEEVEENNTKNLKILRIDKLYRLILSKNGEYNIINSNFATIQGYKFKTAKVEEGKVYSNNGYITFLDKIVEHKANKYVGQEYNDIIITDEELCDGDKDLDYYIREFITNPDKVTIKTALDDMDKYKDISTLLNYHIRNK